MTKKCTECGRMHGANSHRCVRCLTGVAFEQKKPAAKRLSKERADRLGKYFSRHD
jgi:hypothetical protein